MQALILAAGKGNRLGYLGQKTPKCLLPIAKIPIIDRCINNLIKININNIIIVVNYEADKIKEHLLTTYPDINFTFVDENNYPAFERNNLYSFSLALPYIKEDFILIEGDIIFDIQVLEDLISDRKNKVVLSAHAPYAIYLSGNGVIVKDHKCLELTKYNKNIPYLYKTVNIYYLSKSYKYKLIRQINRFLDKNNNNYNHYYEEIFNFKDFKPLIINPNMWYEVDTISDYDTANIIYSKGEEKYNLLSNRFGGHWRFPDLLDYCYLDNPFFNCDKIFNSIKDSFDILANFYPCGDEETRKNAANLFDLKNWNNILVGNGACELIKALGSYFKNKKTYISLPAFNEYIEAFNAIQFKDIEKSKVIIFINPNNPTADYISPKSIEKLFKNNPDKIFIIDESFIDFVEEDIKHSFIGCKYDNIIVVKSLGKSYGINGLKLGVLYSHNLDLINDIKKLLPSWNVNSMAQEFLSQIKLYEKQYKEACNKLIIERKRFINDLKQLSEFLEVYDSQTDFIYIKIKNTSSYKLCVDMLDKYGIFIKDLSDKKGLEKQNYIRLSVKDPATNNYVYRCLTWYFLSQKK